MHKTLICKAGQCAHKALNNSVCSIISNAALEQYAKIVEMIKTNLYIDINKLFGFIALLAILCWVGHWISDIIKFVTRTIPRFIRNLLHGKFSVCLFDCESSKSDSKSKSDKKSNSDSSNNNEEYTEY